MSAKFGWRRPQTLLIVGLVVGFCWALFFNGFLGAKLGVFYYGRVIPGLAIGEGTTHQYPLYDSLAMGIQMMVFTYLLGRTDAKDAMSSRRGRPKGRRPDCKSRSCPSIADHRDRKPALRAVFAPHLITKARRLGDRGAPGPVVFRRAEPAQVGVKEDAHD